MKNKHFIDENKEIFRKKITKESIELEASMTKAAQELSKQKKTFTVPQIYTIDKDNNLIEFELLKEAIPLRVPFNRSLRPFAKSSQFKSINEIFFSLGEILASIHNSDKFESIPKNSFPNNFFKATSKEVYFHGDFTLHNILCHPRLDKIAIIDWSTPQVLDVRANWGPNLWDISMLISTTFHYSPSTFFFSFLKRKNLALSFLRGYQSIIAESKKIDIMDLQDFLRDYNLYKVNPGIKTNFITKYSIIMLGKFIEELEGVREF